MERRKAGMERIRGAADENAIRIGRREKKKIKEKPSLIACSCGSIYPVDFPVTVV